LFASQRRRLRAWVEVRAGALTVWSENDQMVLPWTSVREVLVLPETGAICTLRIRSRGTAYDVFGVAAGSAYRLRHAAFVVGGVAEPSDVRVEQKQEWDQATFVVRYPSRHIRPRRIEAGPDGLRIRYGRRTVVRTGWGEIRRVERTPAGELSWIDNRGHRALVLVPPPVVSAIEQILVQHRDDQERRRTTEDPEALKQLASLRRRKGEREG
ncbi:MAG: hypothetical protein AAF211_27440, partial [Myxococcota bacterium]